MNNIAIFFTRLNLLQCGYGLTEGYLQATPTAFFKTTFCITLWKFSCKRML